MPLLFPGVGSSCWRPRSLKLTQLSDHHRHRIAAGFPPSLRGGEEASTEHGALPDAESMWASENRPIAV